MNKDYIKNLRKELKLSQTALANKVGVSTKIVQDWESGTAVPKSKYTLLQNLEEKEIEFSEKTVLEITQEEERIIQDFVNILAGEKGKEKALTNEYFKIWLKSEKVDVYNDVVYKVVNNEKLRPFD